MNVIFSLAIVIGGLFLLFRLGAPGVMMGVGACLVGLFICGNANIALFGIILTLVGAIVWCSVWSKTKAGREQMNQYTEQIKETEKEYGIIDFSEKEK